MLVIERPFVIVVVTRVVFALVSGVGEQQIRIRYANIVAGDASVSSVRRVIIPAQSLEHCAIFMVGTAFVVAATA
jgi:hypothetical protein